MNPQIIPHDATPLGPVGRLVAVLVVVAVIIAIVAGVYIAHQRQAATDAGFRHAIACDSEGLTRYQCQLLYPDQRF